MKNKENAVQEFMEMICKSWTWKRLTDKERKAFEESVKWGVNQKIIAGTWHHRWMICQAMYESFLAALEYVPFGWREPCVNSN